ncbi:MAG: phosphatase PAP2 family protein [Betaproteobacteria bacterium]|nr:phosphatase PAP2 family protein [Betaproteobacteria bacterium]
MLTPVLADDDAQRLQRSWLIMPLVLLVLLVALESTDIDRTFSHWFFDPVTQTFPWRHSFLLDSVLHHWVKYAVMLVACITAAMLLFTWIVPALRPQRALLLFVVLAMTLAPLTVTTLKQVTDRPCPWDLVGYGGDVPYTHLFSAREPSHARGLCFPAGHAATGFALLAFFFAAHHRRRVTLARAALLAGAVAGFALGMGRVAQGAHFVSHVLWSGLVCWLVMVGLYALLLMPRMRIPVAATSTS